MPDFCCCLYGTSAFITEKYLREAKALLSNAECVMAVTPYEHPIQRAMTVSPQGRLPYLQPEYAKWRTQDCPPAYHDVGLLYYFSVNEFFASGAESFLPMQLKAVIVPEQVQLILILKKIGFWLKRWHHSWSTWCDHKRHSPR